MTVMTSKMWRLRTRACRLGIIIVAALGLAWWIRPGAVYGARPHTELAELFVSLVKQCMARVQAESGEDAEIRSLGASSLVSSLLVNFYNDPVLYRTDPRLCLTGLKKAQGSELVRLDQLDLAQCYIEYKNNPGGFSEGLNKLGRTRNILLDYELPKVQAASERVYACLQGLSERGVVASVGNNYQTADWSGEVRFSWYPVNGTVRLYAVVTFNNHVNVRTVILSATGRVSLQSNRPRKRVLALQDYALSVSTRSLNGKGRWTQPQVPNLAGGAPLFVDNSCRLHVHGTGVEGRVIESVMENGADGVPGNIEYIFSGTTDSYGSMQGSCVIKGDKKALKLRLGTEEPPTAVTWTASRDGDLVKGVIKAGGKEGIPWQVVLSK